MFFGQGATAPAAGDLVKVIGARLNHWHLERVRDQLLDAPSTITSTGNVRAILIAVPRSSSSSSNS